MSWNRQNTGNDPSGKPGRGDASFGRRVRIHIATFLIVVAAVGLWVWRHGTGPAEAVSAGRSEQARPAARKVEKARPAPPKAAPPPKPALPPPQTKKYPFKTYRDARGILRYEGGLRVPGQRPLAEPIDLAANVKRTFKNDAEEHISWLLTMKIGNPVIGNYTYGDAFRKSFAESLKKPTEVLESDDSATRELKKLVSETCEELRQRQAAGEDVAAIMNETLDEFRRLGRYRHELQMELSKITNDSETYTEEDVEDFTEAANKLLEREGLPPLAMPRAVMRGLRKR